VLAVPENEPMLAGAVVQLLVANSKSVYVNKANRENSLIVQFTKDGNEFQPEVAVSVARGFDWTAAFNENLGVAYVCLGIEIVKIQ